MNKGRQYRPLSLAPYSLPNTPDCVGKLNLDVNPDQQVLRMLVESPYSKGLQLPTELGWVEPMIKLTKLWQRGVLGVAHPFVYITVRSGIVSSKNDAVWHVDGFSMKYTHLPEANYVWVDKDPTEYLVQGMGFPPDFNPMRYNIHKYFQNRAEDGWSEAILAGVIHHMDPYVIHRRPPKTTGTQRTFVRVSHTPMEIPDINNTPNPLIPTPHYITDGVRDFRDGLEDYDARAN